MICPNCQNEVPDVANVCGYCGQRLKEATPSQAVHPVSPPPRAAQPSQAAAPVQPVSAQKKGMPGWVWGLIGGLTVLLIFGGYLLLKPDTLAQPAPTVAQASPTQKVESTPTQPIPTVTPPEPTKQVVSEPRTNGEIKKVVVNKSCDPPDITPQDEIMLRVGWGASDDSRAEQNADLIYFVVSVDGKELSSIDPVRHPAKTINYLEELKDFGCHGEGDVISWVLWDFPIGQLEAGTHTVAVAYYADDEIDDGLYGAQPAGHQGTLEKTFVVK